jgi:hypothetical protein
VTQTTPPTITKGTVTLERGAVTFEGEWNIVVDRLIVRWGRFDESALLGMFELEPDKLARMLLAELIDRHLPPHE